MRFSGKSLNKAIQTSPNLSFQPLLFEFTTLLSQAFSQNWQMILPCKTKCPSRLIEEYVPPALLYLQAPLSAALYKSRLHALFPAVQQQQGSGNAQAGMQAAMQRFSLTRLQQTCLC